MASRQGASPTKHLAAVAATGDTLVFLDAHCKPEPGALRRLVEGVEASDGRAIYTPTLIGLDADTFEPIPDQDGHGYRVDLSTLHCYWVPLDSLQRWPETQAYRQPALIGCCVAVSREAYFRCGGFDADMRCWGVEDIDFGLKADRLDYQLCLDPLARVAHRFQAAFTHYGVPSAEVQHNRLRMAWKHYSLGHLEQWLVYNTPFRLVDLTDPTRLETPDASWSPDWIAVLQQFHERKESADAERALLDRLSVRTALDYAADFDTADWPVTMNDSHSLWPAFTGSPIWASCSIESSQEVHNRLYVRHSMHLVRPLAVLDRGYSLTKETQSGRVLRDVRTLQVGDQISSLLAEGSLISRVEHINADED